jgi:hypothetical protein
MEQPTEVHGPLIVAADLVAPGNLLVAQRNLDVLLAVTHRVTRFGFQPARAATQPGGMRRWRTSLSTLPPLG